MKPIFRKGRIATAFTRFLGVSAITLWPFVFVDEDYFTDTIIRHETIHFKQATETLVIPFYVLYLLNYLVNVVIYRNDWKAYVNILAEREAWAFQNVEDYLDRRKPYAWLNPKMGLKNA